MQCKFRKSCSKFQRRILSRRSRRTLNFACMRSNWPICKEMPRFSLLPAWNSKNCADISPLRCSIGSSSRYTYWARIRSSRRRNLCDIAGKWKSLYRFNTLLWEGSSRGYTPFDLWMVCSHLHIWCTGTLETASHAKQDNFWSPSKRRNRSMSK